MKEYLFLGGPWDGTARTIEDIDSIRVPLPENVQATDTETGLPLIGFREAGYNRQKLQSISMDGVPVIRYVMVEEHLTPEQAIEMLKNLLVRVWVSQAPDFIGERHPV